MRTFFVLYAAGNLGALVNTLLGWFLGGAGVFIILGSSLPISVSPPILFQRLVLGGMWSFVYPLFRLSRLPLFHGALLLSLFPTVAELLYFFPKAGFGWLGLEHGMATPVIVLGLNFIWGFVTVFSAWRADR